MMPQPLSFPSVEDECCGIDPERMEEAVKNVADEMGIPFQCMPYRRIATRDYIYSAGKTGPCFEVSLSSDFRNSYKTGHIGNNPEDEMLHAMRAAIWTYGAAIEREQSIVDIGNTMPAWCFVAHPIIRDIIIQRYFRPNLPAVAQPGIDDLFIASVGPGKTKGLSAQSFLFSFRLFIEYNKPFPESMIHSLKGKTLSEIFEWPFSCKNAKIVDAHSKYRAGISEGFTATLEEIPFVRLGEPPPGIDPDPMSSWQQCYVDHYDDHIRRRNHRITHKR